MPGLSRTDMDPFLVELAKSGPWALTAGFLLWKILAAWNADRTQVTQLLGDFRVTLDGVRSEIGNLAKVQTRIMEHLERDERPIRRS